MTRTALFTMAALSVVWLLTSLQLSETGVAWLLTFLGGESFIVLGVFFTDRHLKNRV